MHLARTRIVLVIAIAVGIFLYAAFNIWVFRSVKNGKVPSPKEVLQTVTKSGAGFEVLKSDSLPFGKAQGKPQGVTLNNSSPAPTPTPTPRPTGPGEYACSPAGDCNLYGNETRKAYCTQTYADSSCLDQCGEKTKLCTK